MTKRLTIEEAEHRYSDLIKGQKWVGNSGKYYFICKKHGRYLQNYSHHQQGTGCPICARIKIKKAITLTIEEAEQRQPDLVKGQIWRKSHANYKYGCYKHGVYVQSFDNHRSGKGCLKCARSRILKASRTAKGLSDIPEYVTVVNHYRFIFGNKKHNKTYKNTPFSDDWNPKKGGSYLNGAEWIIDNLGKRPKGASLHIIEHEKGFVPGNLEWAFRNKQTNEQMFKIIANQKHRIKELEAELEKMKKLSPGEPV
jgi:hypothetical protein